MLYYEWKKLYSRTGSKILLCLLAIIFLFCCLYAIQSTTYVNVDGSKEFGISAIHKLKEEKTKWNGTLDEEKIEKVFKTQQSILEQYPGYYPGINASVANSVYSLGQGFSDITDMINDSYSLQGNYDPYLIYRLFPEQAQDFYKNRKTGLENVLESRKDLSQNLKDFYRKQYEENEKPWNYTYQEGWEKLASSLSSLQIFTVIIISLLLASVFSYEDKTGAKAILMTTYKGKRQGILAKIGLGLFLSIGLYTVVTMSFILILLGVFGFDGALNPVQTNFFIGWESPWNLTNVQAISILFVSGLIASLTFSGLTLFVSYRFQSTALASIVAFLIILLPSWIASMYMADSGIKTVIELLPDQLLNARKHLTGMTFLDIQCLVCSPLYIMNIVYPILTLVLLISIYLSARKKCIY